MAEYSVESALAILNGCRIKRFNMALKRGTSIAGTDDLGLEEDKGVTVRLVGESNEWMKGT